MFFWFSLVIQLYYLGYWSLVMHEFTLALVGLINTFILHHYFLRRMLWVATPLNGWLLQLNKFQERGDHGYCVHKTSQYVRCRPYCWSSPRSLMTMAALVQPLRFFRTAIVFSSRTVGYGGWSWWQKTSWTTAPEKIAFPRSCRLPSARHPNGFSLFLYLSKVFYTRLELLLGCG